MQYTLKHPIAYKLGEKSGTIETLEVRRLNGGDMRFIDELEGKPMALTLKLIDRTCSSDVAIDLADKLDVEDVQALGEYLGGMLNASLPTGSNG